MGGRQENDADGALGHTKPAAEQVHAQAAAARRDHLLVGPRGGAAARGSAPSPPCYSAPDCARRGERTGWLGESVAAAAACDEGTKEEEVGSYAPPGPRRGGGGVSWIMGAAPSEDGAVFCPRHEAPVLETALCVPLLATPLGRCAETEAKLLSPGACSRERDSTARRRMRLRPSPTARPRQDGRPRDAGRGSIDPRACVGATISK